MSSKFSAMKRQQAQQSSKQPSVTKGGKGGLSTAALFTDAAVSAASILPSSDLSLLVTQFPLPSSSTTTITRRHQSVMPSSSFSSLIAERDLSVPSGFLSGDFSDDSTKDRDLSKTAQLISQSALNTGLAPGKQLLMTAFMLWMGGNTLQPFSIMMLGMFLSQPIQRIFNTEQEFARYANSNVSLLLPKLAFIACNVAGVLLVLYKMNSMGLLPTSAADWLPTNIRMSQDFAGGALI